MARYGLLICGSLGLLLCGCATSINRQLEMRTELSSINDVQDNIEDLWNDVDRIISAQN